MKMKVAVVMSISGAFDVEITELGKLENGLTRYAVKPVLIDKIDILPLTIASPGAGEIYMDLKEKCVQATHDELITIVAEQWLANVEAKKGTVGLLPLVSTSAN